MTIIEYKNADGKDSWTPFYWPPTNDWDELKLLAIRWNICIRLTNTTTGTVEKEYYPRE